MIRKRHPGVVAEIIIARDQGHSSPFNHSCQGFQGVAGSGRFRDANWQALGQGARPNQPPEEEIVDTVPHQKCHRQNMPEARVSMNVFVRDLGQINHLDGRRLEVVPDGLSLFGGAHLAWGWHRKGAASLHGVAIRSKDLP